ncbi:DUF397 domain-containing protein [Streptomyces sp. NPDC006012]|uniref:DUF397 domain-containing protein n=1 Tax=Streptomyces sp. NPDC006012 TaxID=3364739 RepID=UPI003674F028
MGGVCRDGVVGGAVIGVEFSTAVPGLTWCKSSYSGAEGGDCVEVAWRKSSYSGTEGGDCVEVADGTSVVHVRDSKSAPDAVVTVSRAAWAPGLAWFKSSYSGAEGGQCVEVARGRAVVHIRDSKATAGPVLTVSPGAWAGFVSLAAAKRDHCL